MGEEGDKMVHPSSPTQPVSPRIKVEQYSQDNARNSFDDDDDADDAALLNNDGPQQDRLGTSQDRSSRHNRSSTISSISYDFTANLLALPVSQETENIRNDKHLGLLNGISLVVGLQIGSGIFSSPGIVASDTGSVGAALLVWLGSGLLAWTGASSFAELGAAIPLNGGAQAYLQYSIGPLAGFLFSWTANGALKPGGAAIIALVFGEYMCRIFYHTAFSASSEESARAIPLYVIKIVSLFALLSVAALNAASARFVTRTQIFLTFIKILSLLAIAIIGIVQLARHKQSESFQGNIFENSSTSPGDYALALYSGLWAYDGWDQTNYVAGEMKNVSRDLPRVIHSSLSIVITLYIITNSAYFIVLPKDLVSSSNTVGLDFGKMVFGPVGGVVFALIVAVSCLGALNSSFYTSIRLICSASQEGFLPSIFSVMHERWKTPINALALQLIMTAGYLLCGDFKTLVSFYGVCAWTWHFFTVMSLLALRVREPNLKRPYMTFLPTPIIFSCVALFLLLMPIFSAPIQALLAFGYILLGVPVYYLLKPKERNDYDDPQTENSESKQNLWKKIQNCVTLGRSKINKGYRLTRDDDNDTNTSNSRWDGEMTEIRNVAR